MSSHCEPYHYQLHVDRGLAAEGVALKICCIMRILCPAADADAAPTELKAGFALRLRTNESSVYQDLRYLAVVAFLLLQLLLFDTF